MQNHQHLCQHCFTPIEESSNSVFCCKGCELVFKLLQTWPESEREQLKNRPVTHNADYKWMDETSFREIYQYQNSNNELQKYVFYIEGIHCSACLKLLESLPQFIPGLAKAELHFGTGLLEIEIDSEVSLCETATLINKMGYIPHLTDPKNNTNSFLEKENRKDLTQIAVAAAVAGNIMLLSISIYAGLQGDMAQVFNWLQFFLFLPIVCYSAIPFYKGAIRDIKFKQIGIDLPIVLALIMGTALSVINLISSADGQAEIYFDSTASFILLILASRYLLKRIQQKALAPSLYSDFIQSQGVFRIINDQKIFTPTQLLNAGDLVEIQSNGRIPFDGVLVSKTALIDQSILTGESEPKVFTSTMPILAGSKLLQDHALITVTQIGSQTYLGRTLKEVENQQIKKSQSVQNSDRLAQILIVSVFSLAVLFFASYTFFEFAGGAQEAFRRSLALIIVACPCALALGTPLALARGLKLAAQKGLLSKNAQIFERLSKLQSVAFDKTGTLTTGYLKLKETPLMSKELKSLILSLEEKSQHPIAFALRRSWGHLPLLKVDEYEEIPGLGIKAKINGDSYTITKESSESKSSLGPQITIKKNDIKIMSLNFTDETNPEAATVIKKINDLGYKTYLISGDHEGSVYRLGQQVGISQEQILFNQTPENKAEFFKTHQNTLMVGDGGNDLLAMNKALGSVAVKGSVSECLKTADVYLSNGHLDGIVNLILIAKQTRQILKRNLSIALIYNIATGSAALLGLVGPLAAAVLMPLSSIALILSSSKFSLLPNKTESTK
jgi:P-type Cu+ transporter